MPMTTQTQAPSHDFDAQLERHRRELHVHCYRMRAPGDTEYRAFKFDVLRVESGKIAEITTFDAGLFPAFGLPQTLGEAAA